MAPMKKATVKPVVKADETAKVTAPKTVEVKTEAAKAAIKAEAPKAEAKKEEVKKEEAKKAEKKPAVKKVAETKATAEKAVEKKVSAVKKAVAKKAPAKKAELKTAMQLQFSGKSYTQDDLVKIAKDVWKYDLKQKVGDLTSVELYVKPEENQVYYVMNKEFTGSFYI